MICMIISLLFLTTAFLPKIFHKMDGAGLSFALSQENLRRKNKGMHS